MIARRKFRRLRTRHLKLGMIGEGLAGRLLSAKGYELLVKNYRCHEGEIDIVARDGSILCFVEVKTRSFSPLRRGRKSWLGRKQAIRIEKAAKRYICEMVKVDVEYRFDLIEVFILGAFVREIFHWERAFG